MGEIVVVGTSCPSVVPTYPIIGQPLCHLSLRQSYISLSHETLAINFHLVRDLVQSSELCVVYVSAGDHLANTLTKSLSRPHLFSLCNKIGVTSGAPS